MISDQQGAPEHRPTPANVFDVVAAELDRIEATETRHATKEQLIAERSKILALARFCLAKARHVNGHDGQAG